MTEPFLRQLMISAAAHLGVASLVFLKAVFMPSEPIEIRRAIHVDVVGLPDKIVEMPKPDAKPPEPAPAPPLPKPAPEPPQSKTPPPKAEVTPPKPEAPKVDLSKKQNRALERLKAMAALEKIQGEVEKKDQNKKEVARPVKGNQVSEGNSLTGLERIEYDRYFDDLEKKIHENWSIPQWLADANLKAQIQVLIDERGFVIKKLIRKSSGNEVFDSKVIEAIESSNPLPAPPPRLKGLLSTSGIIFNFPE
ncbi:MAG: energy transducer TonB [Bdellovibrionales bacterium]